MLVLLVASNHGYRCLLTRHCCSFSGFCDGGRTGGRDGRERRGVDVSGKLSRDGRGIFIHFRRGRFFRSFLCFDSCERRKEMAIVEVSDSTNLNQITSFSGVQILITLFL